MATKNQDKTSLMISLFAIALSIGIPAGTTIQSAMSNELKDYYICSVSGDILEARGGLSSSLYTAYPNAGSKIGGKPCIAGAEKGSWQSLKAYAERLGIDPYTLITPIKPAPFALNGCSGESWGECYTCYPKPIGCQGG